MAASSLASAALIVPIMRLLATNDCSIVSLFYRKDVRSNADTVVSYRRGLTLSTRVEQMFDVYAQSRYRLGMTAAIEPEARDE